MAKAASPGTDNLEFELVGPADSKVPFAGYVSAVDPTAAAAQTMIRGSQNVYKKLTGTIANRSGLKVRGASSATQAGTVSSFEWESSLGTIYPVRQNNSQLQVEFDAGSGPIWYPLITGLPSDICSYTPWYDSNAEKDYLLIVNGQQNIIQWTGGIIKIATAANTAGIIGSILNPNNVTNANTGEWSSGGIGYVVGDLITVSGGNGDAILEVDSIIAGGVASVAVDAQGTGYNVGDLVEINTGTVKALVQVTAETGGNVTAVQVVATGYGASPVTGESTTNIFTSGSPSGLTITINTVGNTIASWHFTNNGDGYSASGFQNASATTGGTGTGASIYITTVLAGRATISGSETIPELGFPGDLTPTNGVIDNVGGTLVSGGISYTYTALGDNGFSFVGFGIDPSPMAASVALSAPNTIDTSATSTDAPYTASDSTQQYAAQLEEDFFNDAIAVVNNQVHLICYTSRLIHVSSSFHFDHYDVYQLNLGVIRTPGYPDILTLDSSGRAVASQGGNALVFGSLGDSYLVTRKSSIYNEGTGFAALSYENVTVAKETSSDLSSPLGQDFITSIGDIVLFVDGNNQLRQYGLVRNITQPVYPILSLDIYTELSQADLTGGALRAVGEQSGETVYITAPNSGLTYVYQLRQRIDAVGNLGAERIWQPPQVWGISRVAVIDGVSYGHSNANPMIWQLWDTGQYHDDLPDGTAGGYLSRVLFGYQSFGRRQGKFTFDKLFFEGYIIPDTNLYGDAYYDYQGSTFIQPVVINSVKKPAKIFTGLPPVSIGKNPINGQPLGTALAQIPQDTVPKFRAIRQTTIKPCYEYTLDVYSNDADAQWELLTVGINGTESPFSGIELMN